MPDFDGGHYFLTVLIPVKTGCVDQEEGSALSPVQLLRNALIALPSGEPYHARGNEGEGHAINSPFAVSLRTHLARFVVIEDVAYNGREPRNAIVAVAIGANPVVAQKVDKLNSPYLLFSADIDAESDDPAEVRSYLTELWEGAEEQLRSVFIHCFAFNERVHSANDFCDYIQACQVETTMPFNDYWRTPPPLKNLAITPLAVIGVVSVVVALLSLSAWLLHAIGFGFVAAAPPAFGVLIGSCLTLVMWLAIRSDGLKNTSPIRLILLYLSGFILFTSLSLGVWQSFGETKDMPWGRIGLAAMGLALAAFFGLYKWITMTGAKPYPTAPDSTLPHVLKALYLQEKFTRLAINVQGASDDDLYRDFGKFIEKTQPLKPSPRQHPGHFGA